MSYARVRQANCQRCGTTLAPGRYTYCTNTCRNRAWDYHKNHRRRAATSLTDLTPAMEQTLRLKAKRCTACGCHMVNAPYTPRSKELDHILGLHVGGTHTLSNIRIICRSCNQARPKDCSDTAIQLSMTDTGSTAKPCTQPKPRPRLTAFELARRATRRAARHALQHRDHPTPSQHYPSPTLIDHAIRPLHANGLGQKAMARRLHIGRDSVRSAYTRMKLPRQGTDA